MGHMHLGLSNISKHSFDYRLNGTPLSFITITNYIHILIVKIHGIALNYCKNVF